MKTLKQQLQENGFNDDWQLVINNVRLWLEQKRQQKALSVEGWTPTQAHHTILQVKFLDELLEELKQ